MEKGLFSFIDDVVLAKLESGCAYDLCVDIFHFSLMCASYRSFFAGQANAMAPDQAKAHLGVAEIFRLLDRKPEIRWDEEEEEGLT